MWESHDRYPKRHQLNRLGRDLDEIEFRVSLLRSDDWLANRPRHADGYRVQLWPNEPRGTLRVLLDTPLEPVEPEPWNCEKAITSEIELRSTLAVAEGLLGYELARPPPFRDLRTYVTADPFLVDLHERWRSQGCLLVSPPRPLHELLDPFAASLESYLTIESIYARVNGPRFPRKRR